MLQVYNDLDHHAPCLHPGQCLRFFPLVGGDVEPHLIAPIRCATYFFAVKLKPAVRIFYPGNSGLKFSMKDTQLTKDLAISPESFTPTRSRSRKSATAHCFTFSA